MREGLIKVLRPYAGGRSRLKWIRAPGVRCPSQENSYHRAHFHKIRMKVLEALGGKCKCGFSDDRALQVDHINSDGNIERRQVTSGVGYYYHLLRNIHSGKYQVLCANCNMIKRVEKKEYSWEREK